MSALPQYTGSAGHGSNEDYYSNGPVELPAHEPADTRPAQQSHLHPAGVDAGAAPPPPPPPPPPGQTPLSASASSPPLPPYDQEQPQAHNEKQQYFPPPPPGPPPATSSYGQQGYYPPPPPGPPPGFASDAPPPGYTEEFGEGAGFGAGDVKTHDPDIAGSKPPGPGLGPGLTAPGPPALPPRPVSSSGMQFAPPPTSPSTAQDGGHGKAGSRFTEKLYQWSVKAGAPVNRIAHRLGAEAFWPMTLDLECEKAARILRSFCKDGFYTATSNAGTTTNTKTTDTHRPSSPAPKPTPRPSSPQSRSSQVLVKIPASVIASAKGLAIFTTFRTGFHVSGAAGSGVVVARLPDGSWSPPAGFLVHTLGAGLMIGIDVYDCVCVLTTQRAVDAFARRARVSLGGEIGVAAGPVGAGGAVEGVFEGGSSRKGSKSPRPGSSGKGNAASTGDENRPVWMYMKSRGFYVGVQADGTVIIPRADANAAFYGEQGITVERILNGQVPVHHQAHAHAGQADHAEAAAGGKVKAKDRELVMWPEGGRQLSEVLRAVEGKGGDANLAQGPTPGDVGPPPPPLDGGKV